MAAPTQALPSWLSDSTSLATDSAGQATATFTTVVSLPLTYYGPLIPLGPDGVWVYGGLFPPASSASNPLSTTVASSVLSSTLATPSPLTATPSTAGPTRSSASLPSSSPPSSFLSGSNAR
ncbi:hypothetical protein BGW80DRAFT_1466699 [Lactifluus volemus]|nr:hypothetical protein BGW80DRAFT_1466699 [Lactifluus volemus]